MTLLARILLLPSEAADMVRTWWLTEDGLAKDGLADDGHSDDVPVVALVAPESVICRWYHYPALAPRQAEAAARIDAATASINGNALHIVSQEYGDGEVVTAAIDREQLTQGLDRIKAEGLDPDHLLPLGLLLPDQDGTATRLSFADTAVIRCGRNILPDEAMLASAMIGDKPVHDVTENEFAQYLRAAVANPIADLRTGSFAKKRGNSVWSGNKIRAAVGLFAMAAIFSLALAMTTWLKIDRAIAREDAGTLAAAGKVVPGLTIAAEAPARLAQKIGVQRGGNSAFTALASGLWRALQKAEGVNLRDMRYGKDGILSVTLTSAAVDPVNRVLIDVQQQGYKISATPRQEANGITAVAVTMRAP
jgi:general secretion pathway protein L